MNTIQLIGMGVWLAITFYVSIATISRFIEYSITKEGVDIGFESMTSSIGWTGIILYYTFN